MRNPDPSQNELSNDDEWARCIYERAQETAHHSDVVIYEIAAIVWSAETLLLGFVLEVPSNKFQQSLVIVASILAMLFAAYVPFVMIFAKIGQHKAFDICKEIEEKLPEELRLHQRISAVYPKRRWQIAVYFMTAVFFIAWAYVLHRAINCVFHPECCA